MAKYCKECGKLNENPMLKYCMEHANMNKQIKRTSIKPGLPPKKIGKKRIQRIKEKGSEFKVFVEIWKEREHICENCNKYIKLFDVSNFAHKLNKRDYPKLRYIKDNIALVHGIWEEKDETGKTYNCHREFDLNYKKVQKRFD